MGQVIRIPFRDKERMAWLRKYLSAARLNEEEALRQSPDLQVRLNGRAKALRKRALAV